MCLAVPAQIIAMHDHDMATADIQSVQQNISTALVDVNIGDWVLIHAGFAIQRLEPEEARLTLELFSEIIQKMDSENERYDD